MMRRDPRRPGSAARAFTLVAACGCLGLLVPGARSIAEKAKPTTEQSIGDVAEPTGGPELLVEGVGLVIGLQDTGSDPTPSWYREKLLGELKRNPNLDAEAILASPKTSLVIVRGKISPGVSKQDDWDVEVVLPPGSTTTSLEGGFLMETELSMVGIASEGPMEGKPLAKAYGPLLTGSVKEPDDLKAARVLGGARAKQPRPYILYIEERHQNGRMSKKLQDLVNFRFHERDPGRQQAGMATAKTDKHLELRVPRVYHQNQIRFLQVVKSLRLTDSPELFQQRLDKWGRELMDPATAGEAAVRLEGLGKNAVATLQKGLTSDNAQVRFFAAEALAYLDDPAGVDELSAAIVAGPNYRVFALAALGAMGEPAARVRLRELLSQPDAQVRYGAFDALRRSDPRDPRLGRVRVLLPPAQAPSDDDAMAYQMSPNLPTPRPDPIPEDPFELYIVDCDGPPMVHVSSRHRREIVLFGGGHELLPPVVLGGAGPILLNATANDRVVEVTRIETGERELLEQTFRSSPDLVNILRTVASLGATYPEVVSILQAASTQANLSGPLMVDALPAPSEKYDEAQILGKDVSKQDADVQVAGHEEAKDGDAEARRGPFQRFRDRLRRNKPNSPESGGDD